MWAFFHLNIYEIFALLSFSFDSVEYFQIFELSPFNCSIVQSRIYLNELSYIYSSLTVKLQVLTGGCWEKEWGFPWRPFSSGGGGRWRIQLSMSSSRGVRVEEPRSACSTDISSRRRWTASYLPNASVTFIWWSDP